MTYDFSDRLDYLGTRMQDLHQNELLYTRDSVDLKIENFTPEETDTEQLQALGIAILNEKWQDFVFDADELSDFTMAEPEAGDTLTWGDMTFQIVSINDKLFKYTTSSRKRIRIHTKQIA